MSGLSYHAWTHRPKALGGTDPIDHGHPTWVAANGLVYSSGATSLTYDQLFTGVWIDQNPKLLSGTGNTYFLIDQNTTAVDGSGEDAFGIRLKQPYGVYTFTLKAETSDLSAGDDHEIFISMRLVESTGAYMPNYADLAAGNNTLLLDLQETVEAGNAGQWIGMTSITTPIFGAATLVKTGRIAFSYSNPGVDNAWNFSLWIVRHGDVFWTDADMTDPSYGIAIPTG